MAPSKAPRIALTLALSLAACDSGGKERLDAARPPDAGAGSDPSDEVDDRPLPSGAPASTGTPNVPEFKPAFPEQTRAPGMTTQTPFDVVEVASGFNKPWAIAFLPDKRMLVTEKATGKLYIVTPDGTKSPAVMGLPEVDARGQGGLLDVEVGPDYARSGLIYWTYYEPRQGGNGLAVARAKLNDAAAPSVGDLQIIFRMMPTLESTLQGCAHPRSGPRPRWRAVSAHGRREREAAQDRAERMTRGYAPRANQRSIASRFSRRGVGWASCSYSLKASFNAQPCAPRSAAVTMPVR